MSASPVKEAIRRSADLYKRMLVIRRAEERLQKLFADGEVPGFLHLSIGQEAVAVGVCACLEATDTIASNHRGHGHAIAKGVELVPFFAEVLGRSDGACGGFGGSMHVADFSVGMLGANGIVGAGLPIGVGSALALKRRGDGGVAAVFFGDGALAEGTVHESFNIAALWNLPVLFVCENNGWSEFSPIERQLAARPESLAAAFGIEFVSADGTDVADVAEKAGGIVERMRRTPAPALLECRTHRFRGHFEGDRQDYRPAEELAGLDDHDPLQKMAARLFEAGFDQAWFDSAAAETEALIESAVGSALASPESDAGLLLANVYTTEGA